MMNSYSYPFRQDVYAPVIDAESGVLLEIEGQPTARRYANPPIAYFFPKDPVYLIQWGDIGARVNRAVAAIRDAEIRAYGAARTKFAPAAYKMWIDTLTQVFEVNGHKVSGWYGFGSGAKPPRRVTPGLVRDYLVESGLVLTDAQSSYLQRMLLTQAMWGAGIIRSPRVCFVNDQYLWAGKYPIFDGLSLISRSHYELFRDEEMADITLSRDAHQSYQVSQRFEWVDVADEVKMMLDKQMERLETVTTGWETTRSDPSEYKRRLCEANPLMFQHPFVAEAVEAAWARTLMELSHSIPFESITRIAVPVQGNKFVYGEPGDWILNVWPMDGWGNITTFTNESDLKFDPLYQSEWDRIGQSTYGQWTVTNPDLIGIKGNFLVVDDEEMGGFDLVISCEDVKLINLTSSKDYSSIAAFRKMVRKRKRVDATQLFKDYNLYVGFTQVWEPGTAIGCPYDQWIEMGRDWDGDYGTLSDGKGLPKIRKAILNMPKQASKKPNKVQRGLENRVQHLMNVMQSPVGIPVNFITDCLSGGPGYMRSVVAPLVMKMSSEKLDEMHNYIVHCYTDAAKRSADLHKMTASIAQMSNRLFRLTGGGAPWARWIRMDSAFRNVLPGFLSDHPEMVERAKRDDYFRQSEHYRMMVTEVMEQSTPGHIFRYVLPWIEKHFDFTDRDGLSIRDRTETRPLSDFLNIAPPVQDADVELGHEFLERVYLPALREVKWFDQEYSIPAFKDSLQKWAKEWADKHFGGKYDYASWALWRASHYVRGKSNRGAAPFYAFPDECLNMAMKAHALAELEGEERQEVLLESGWADKVFSVPVMGLQRNLISPLKTAYGPVLVRIEDVTLGGDGGKTKLGVILVRGTLPLIRGDRPGVPKDLIGTVGDVEAGRARREGITTPPRGIFNAQFYRVRSTVSYIMKCTLVENLDA